MKKNMILLSIMLLLASCFQENIPTIQGQEIPLTFMKSSSIDVAVATCRVTADDMDTIQVALAVSPTEISGNIPQVPYGDARLFEIFCYSSAGTMNYYGSVEADINSMAPVINIVLYPYNNEANVSIRGTFGDPDSDNEKIVFSADWDGSNNIYIMNPDGSALRQLTASPYDDNYPILSPDRSKLCFHRWDPNGVRAYILNITSGELTEITLEGYRAHCFYWHPNGQSLLFHSTINGSCDIFSYDLQNDNVSTIIQDSSTSWCPSYSSDGSKIIYYSNKSGQFKTYIANSDGTEARMLNPSGLFEEKVPDMNPVDMDLVVYSKNGQELSILNTKADTCVSIDLIQSSEKKESWPRWSPDGCKIVFEGVDTGNSGIYVVNSDGSGETLLIDHVGNERYPFWR